jgi:hypothetical protein
MALALMVFDRLPLPRTYWVAIAGILALALPPAILAGRLDVRVQQALKQRQISRRPRGGVQVTGTTAPVEADRTA